MCHKQSVIWFCLLFTRFCLLEFHNHLNISWISRNKRSLILLIDTQIGWTILFHHFIRRRQRDRINFSKEPNLKNFHSTRRRRLHTIQNWHWTISVSKHRDCVPFLMLIVHVNFSLAVCRRARKSILITLPLVILNSLQGFTILITYVTEIFAHTNSNLTAIESSIIITSLLILGNLIVYHLIDRAGRRRLYVCSSFATSLALAFFAAYLYFFADSRAYEWAPIVSISFIIFFSCLGMTPVPFILMIEIFPQKVWTGFIPAWICFINKFCLSSLQRFNIMAWLLTLQYYGLLDFSWAKRIHRSKLASVYSVGSHFLR